MESQGVSDDSQVLSVKLIERKRETDRHKERERETPHSVLAMQRKAYELAAWK